MTNKLNLLVLTLFLAGKVQALDASKKKGVALGLGVTLSQLKFPVQFTGSSKNKIDDTATLLGPSLQLGFDQIIFERLLIGLRLEGYVVDTLGMGRKENQKRSDQTIGKTRAYTTSLRTGWLFDFKPFNPVGVPQQMVGEFFFEGGISRGRKTFGKKFNYNDGVINEFYHENVSEDFTAHTLSFGANITTDLGAFAELKLLQTSIISNQGTFSGTSRSNGGVILPTNQTLKDYNKLPTTSVFLTVGHHY